MIKVFLVVLVCAAPDYTRCNQLESFERPDPITCQKDRILAGRWWLDEIRRQGFSKGVIFTHCELVNSEKNGRRG